MGTRRQLARAQLSGEALRDCRISSVRSLFLGRLGTQRFCLSREQKSRHAHRMCVSLCSLWVEKTLREYRAALSRGPTANTLYESEAANTV